MGGKHKQAQRTKNNARPANSGRTAALLGSSNKLQIGVTVLKNAGHMPAMRTFMDDPNDPNVNQDFQLVLKKMSKKDATTKLKALHEFGTLCQNSEPDAVKAILPFWPRLFCVLVTDLENRVREAAHSAHRAVVNRVGRNIAPHLKQLIGPWFTGQYDTYPPAASTAKLAFQEAFSTNKMTEAIIFCQQEILNYVSTNLLDYNPKSFCIDKILTEEEMVAKFQRVTISSLHGYSLYLTRVPEDQLRNAEEKNKEIVSSSKFWKLAKHEVALVRSAWFSALISICQNAPFLLENESKNVGTTVFGNIDESDPTVLPVVWEAALHSVVAVKDLWTHESTVKLTSKKLWNILREGGQGNASVIFPNLLPLLSKIPSTVLDKKRNFYTAFFEHMRAGLIARSVQQSITETEAVVSSFMECIRYVIMINKEDKEFCENLLNNQIFPLLESVMTDPRLQSASETLSLSVSQLLHYWSRQNDKIYEDLVTLFWNRIDLLCSTAINNALLDIKLLSTVLDAQSNLLITLRFPNPRRQKKQLKVKFSDNAGSPQDTKDSLKDENEPSDSSDAAIVSCVFENSLYNMLNNLLKLYTDFSDNLSKRTMFVKHISKLVCKFDSEIVFRQLCNLSGGHWETLYNKKLMPWLKDETVLVEYCLSIIFTMLKYIKKEEKQKVLEDLSKVQTNCVLQWCVQDENSSMPAVREWLQSDELSVILIDIARNVTGDELNLQTIKKCFAVTENRGLLISTKALYGIINEFSRTLTTADTTSSAILCISDLMYSLFSEKNYSFLINPESCLIDLVLSAFRAIIHGITVKELVASWKNSIQILSKVCGTQSPVFVQLTQKCANYITETMNIRSNPSDDLERFVNHTADFVHSAVNCFPDVDEPDELTEIIIPIYKIFVDSLISNSKQWENEVLQTTFYAEYIGGKVYIKRLESCQQSSKNEKKNDPLNNIEVVKYATCIMFPLHLFDELSKPLEDEQQERFKQNFITNLTEILVVQPLMLFAVCRCFEQHFSATKQFFRIRNYLEYLEKYLKDVVEKLDSDAVTSVVGTYFANAPSQKTMWYWLTNITKFPELYKMYENTAEDTTSQTISTLPQPHPSDTVIEQCMESLDSPVLDAVKLKTLNLCFEEIGNNITDVTKVRCSIALDKIMNMVQNNRRYLVDWNDSEVQERIASIADFLHLTVKYYTAELTQPQWDFCVISTSTWIDRVYNFVAENNRESVTTLAFVALAASVCRLFDSVSKYLAEPAEDDPVKQTRQTEWKEVLVSYIHKHITNTWSIIAEWDCNNALLLCLVENVGLVVSRHVTYPHFADSKTAHTWLERCCKFVESPVTSIQITAYHLILTLIPSLVAMDSDSEGGITWLKMEEIFKHTQTVVDTMLLELRFGDTCIVEAFTDSYTYARGYLLMWCAILEHCAQSNSQIRSLYTAWLKEDYLPVLMKSVFCLMPEAVVHCYEFPQKRVQELFGKMPDLFDGVWDSNKLAHLSCCVYACALRRVPAAIRQWWTEAEHKVSAIVDKVTTLFVSPSVSAEEIRSVKQEKKFDNMTVIVHPTAREIVAVYTIEESSMELIIQLPPNHPLGLVKVDSGKCMVSTAQTRQWLLQLAIFLTHQNGSIWDGLVLWKSSLDKRFEGVEECYICFAILHNPSHQLPKLSCHTCRKKFHSHCLYKWFTTSNKSTCPICRNTF